MPQMSPMPWMLIMVLTMFCLMLILSNIYFFKTISNTKKISHKMVSPSIWW